MFTKTPKPKKIIYLDHAAATPLDARVFAAMKPFFGSSFGNPSSLYQKGIEAKKAVEASRRTIAALIGAHQKEIIFTAGGSESVNLAIFGIARMNAKSHLVASSIEHHCVINSFKALEQEGYKATFVPVDAEGFIDINQLKKSIRPQTILISVMLANNEIGTIEPVAEIGKWLKGENRRRLAKHWPQIIFHTDACQAAGFLDLDVNKLGVDLMSVNGSKIYGPKQTGFLYVRAGINLKPLIYGGGQEMDLRGGTENVAGVVGLAAAFKLAQKDKVKENAKLFKLNVYALRKIQKLIPSAILNGPAIGSKRLPNNLNLTFKGIEGEALMLYLDANGICVSTSSACSTGTTEASHVILALGREHADAKSAIRFTFGKQNNKSEINYLLKVLPKIIKILYKAQK